MNPLCVLWDSAVNDLPLSFHRFEADAALDPVFSRTLARETSEL